MKQFDKEKVLENKKRLYEKIRKEINQREKKIEKYQEEDRVETPSSLMIKKFKKHKLAIYFFWLLVSFYIFMFFSGFFAPYDGQYKFKRLPSHPPTGIHLFDETGKYVGPYVYEYQLYNVIFKRYRKVIDKTVMVNGKKITIYKKKRVYFFAKGQPYKLFFLIPSRIHLFTTKVDKRGDPDGAVFLFGSDKLGRDIFSRVFIGAWISLTVGFVGTFLSLIIAIVLGGIAGYFGGATDWIIMRICEIFMLFPSFYFLLFLRSLIPSQLSPSAMYFMIVVILSLISWAGLSRVLRSMILSIKNEDFVLAAQAQGIKKSRIIFKHVLPQLSSYIIINISLSIPGYILGETGLSFLGLGISEPSISWGMLLSDAVQPYMVAAFPWIIIPSIFIILTVMSFNMIGDALRDALDPRTKI